MDKPNLQFEVESFLKSHIRQEGKPDQNEDSKQNENDEKSKKPRNLFDYGFLYLKIPDENKISDNGPLDLKQNDLEALKQSSMREDSRDKAETVKDSPLGNEEAEKRKRSFGNEEPESGINGLEEREEGDKPQKENDKFPNETSSGGSQPKEPAEAKKKQEKSPGKEELGVSVPLMEGNTGNDLHPKETEELNDPNEKKDQPHQKEDYQPDFESEGENLRKGRREEANDQFDPRKEDKEEIFEPRKSQERPNPKENQKDFLPGNLEEKKKEFRLAQNAPEVHFGSLEKMKGNFLICKTQRKLECSFEFPGSLLFKVVSLASTKEKKVEFVQRSQRNESSLPEKPISFEFLENPKTKKESRLENPTSSEEGMEEEQQAGHFEEDDTVENVGSIAQRREESEKEDDRDFEEKNQRESPKKKDQEKSQLKEEKRGSQDQKKKNEVEKQRDPNLIQKKSSVKRRAKQPESSNNLSKTAVSNEGKKEASKISRVGNSWKNKKETDLKGEREKKREDPLSFKEKKEERNGKEGAKKATSSQIRSGEANQREKERRDRRGGDEEELNEAEMKQENESSDLKPDPFEEFDKENNMAGNSYAKANQMTFPKPRETFSPLKSQPKKSLRQPRDSSQSQRSFKRQNSNFKKNSRIMEEPNESLSYVNPVDQAADQESIRKISPPVSFNKTQRTPRKTSNPKNHSGNFFRESSKLNQEGTRHASRQNPQSHSKASHQVSQEPKRERINRGEDHSKEKPTPKIKRADTHGHGRNPSEVESTLSVHQGHFIPSLTKSQKVSKYPVLAKFASGKNGFQKALTNKSAPNQPDPLSVDTETYWNGENGRIKMRSKELRSKLRNEIKKEESLSERDAPNHSSDKKENLIKGREKSPENGPKTEMR